MKVAIIGAGNMGGAIARGLAKGTIIPASDIIVANPSQGKLDKLKAEFPKIQVTHDNREASCNADILILAVKPWLVEEVINELDIKKETIVVSVVAGLTCHELALTIDNRQQPIFRLIPNTAISERQSMTLITGCNYTEEQKQLILDVFNEMGMTMFLPETKMEAATAMTSCGIAYVLKYIQAAMQAGIELGIYPKDGMRMVAQSVKGAAELILN
ncbi:MAG: NAD(P)-binding domain-containing protein, partial [Bacteroides sp.]|nr:NAD(P)-binding domain-containing protein [Bacteroides sp.]